MSENIYYMRFHCNNCFHAFTQSFPKGVKVEETCPRFPEYVCSYFHNGNRIFVRCPNCECSDVEKALK